MKIKNPHIFILATMPILVFAGLINYFSATRGFFALDQSVAFDGGYRILCGQIPYKDFYAPCGPISFWLQAGWFKIFGTNYFQFVISASFFNAVAALFSMLFLRIFIDKKWIVYVGGILTAIWFYPPFGTPYYEQISNLFNLIGMALTAYAVMKLHHKRLVRSLVLVMGGCMAVISILSKQNTGLFFLPVFFVIILVGHSIKQKLIDCIFFIFGIILLVGFFLGWLLCYSELDTFVKCVLQTPSSLGIVRLFSDIPALIRSLIFIDGPYSSRVSSFLMIFALFVCFVRNISNWNGCRKSNVNNAAIYIAGCLALVQNLVRFSALNQVENMLPFAGIIMAFCIDYVLVLVEEWKSRGILKSRSLVYGMGLLVFFLPSLLAKDGITTVLRRNVQDPVFGSEFPHVIDVGKLKPMRWGVPTMVRGSNITEDEFVELYHYLEERNQNFFIFPDFTLLYGILDKVPPQPLLWFHRGLTYPLEYDPLIDNEIKIGIESKGVNIIVLEMVNWWEIGIGEFPVTTEYISSNFLVSKQIGHFLILERNICNEI